MSCRGSCKSLSQSFPLCSRRFLSACEHRQEHFYGSAKLQRIFLLASYPPGRELQLEKTNRSVSVREGEEVTLHCLLQGAHLPATHLSATWFRGEESRHVRPLLTLRHDGAIEYPVESLARRLHLRRPTTGDFSLTLRSVEEGDAGVYHCQVQEWQQKSKGTDWALQALARSGYTRLTTTPPGNATGCEGRLTPHQFPLSHTGMMRGG